ncbi:MAG TPA: AAA family ATPase [Candidatus Sulfotelmatobacter sp.]|nr:AAA family ATPase [Candidatus Sulfotelmatobacter sp.]
MGGSGNRGIASPTLVGREAEVDRLGAMLSEAALGDAHAVLLSGEAGVGKTRVVTAVVERAVAAGFRVTIGRCLELGTAIPYLPFAEILRGLTRELSPADRQRVLGPAMGGITALAHGTRAAASLADVVERGPLLSAAVLDLGPLPLYEALLHVVERLTEATPLLVVLEDLHWADRSSLDLMSFLVHSLRRVRALMVMTARSEALVAGGRLTTAIADLERDGTVERIELEPLSLLDTGRQVAAILGYRPDASTIGRIQALSGGNPLYTEELVASGLVTPDADASLSMRLRDVLAARSSRLPATSREVLRVASAAGRVVHDRLLTAVSGLPAQVVAEGLRAAIAEQILVPVKEGGAVGYRFRHELLRTTVESELLPGERASLHARFASALADGVGGSPSPAEIAYHLDAAGETQRALPAHIEAGIAAEGVFAFAEAAQHFERALVLWDLVPFADDLVGIGRLELLQRAADTAALAGEHELAVGLFRTLIRALDPVAQREQVSVARSHLRWCLWEAGDQLAALANAEEEVDAAPSGEATRIRANALGHLAGLLLFTGHLRRAKREARRALQVAVAAGAREEAALAEGVLGWCLIHGGQGEAGVEAIRSAWATARALGDVQGLALAYAQLASALEYVGRLDEALVIAIEGRDVCSAHGVERTFGPILAAAAARIRYLLGRWDEAKATVATAMAAQPVGPGRLALVAVTALVAVGRGQASEAADALAEAEELGRRSTSREHLGWLAAAKAEATLWRGEPHAALLVLADLLAGDAAPGAASGLPGLGASGGRLLALAAWAAADLSILEQATRATVTGAEGAVVKVTDLARAAQALPVLRRAWAAELGTVRAEVARAHGARGGLRVRAWTTAAAVAAEAGRPYAESYARWRVAEASVGDRASRDRAGEEAREAATIASRLGAGPLAQGIADLARRARLPATPEVPTTGQPAERAPRSLLGLTARESEVLSLLAAGRTNREIAELLFISPKTASVHVSNILGKLGVEGRVEAAVVAQRVGLVDDRPASSPAPTRR